MTAAPPPPPRGGRSPFEVIAALLHARSGLSLTADKLYLLESRLAPVLARRGIDDLAALAARLQGPGAHDAALVGDVVEAMTINETFFFRDGKPFDHLRDVVLPAVAAARPAGQPLRFWSAASSSGQEAYSIAMLMAENRPRLGRRAEIVGTDISPAQVERATRGLYSHFEVQRGLPIALLMKHFARGPDGWEVAPALRQEVRFRTFNLLDDTAALGRFDVIFCRNVLIYFDAPTKTRILERMARQLAPDGVLYLGGAETVLGLTTRFRKTAAEPCFRPVPDGEARVPSAVAG